ncbi:cis-3-alkyl-4-alkyloxetan-2-one decarboxylase isoform X1 [Triticum aestivum]|uniref:cis-3-alkyl-4-alkyloxetan-2-one decarboxylase isoform X1 n=1 Tax=Triticum aestivum TaxID=4565 RepID=UPI001D00C98B|nr:cis-3-alkyl-4-alkyloxetan-2-one decarboxylase-like isoform X1 [Triticum aestivum]
MAPPLAAPRFHAALPRGLLLRPRKPLRSWRRAARPDDQDLYVDDDIGDGFSFSGGELGVCVYACAGCKSLGGFLSALMLANMGIDAGKYAEAEGPSKSDEWFAQGRMVKAHALYGNKEKAKDPFFGLTMGSGSQSSGDVFNWFCVEAGSSSNPTVLLIHGFPSQAYSYRNVLPVLSDKYRSIAFDWLGFGFSDKPQPKYGFDYTLDEYTSALESLIDAVAPDKLSIVVQGYFAPIVVKYANEHQDKLNHLILVNPPITDKHAKLPSTLACFSNFLLGEVFSQDPLRASDKALTSSGPYMMKEEDATVYRRPYLVSGASGFALNAITRAMGKDLKAYIESMRSILASDSWNTKTTICWGLRDRWLTYDGVEDFCDGLKHNVVQLPMAGHHAQEDRGEELGNIIKRILR